jgi:hypothetical protein
MFVVDLLHEFELGVWKAVFTHLMRILYAAGGDCIQTLNKRLVLLPSHVLCVNMYVSDSVKYLLLVETQYVASVKMHRR